MHVNVLRLLFVHAMYLCFYALPSEFIVAFSWCIRSLCHMFVTTALLIEFKVVSILDGVICQTYN